MKHSISEHPRQTASCPCEDASLSNAAPKLAASGSGLAIYRIASMDCTAEERDIRTALAAIPGIRSLFFNLTQRTLSIDAGPADIEKALASLRYLGFEPVALPSSRSHSEGSSPDFLRAGIALLLAIGAELIDYLAPEYLAFKALSMLLATIAIGLAGLGTYRKGLSALRRVQMNMNALMAVAVTGAFVIGQWPEAAMVMALYAIAELIEARSVERARNTIKKLLEITPDQAEILQPDDSWTMVPVAGVQPGTRVRVKPGSRIPLDGRVIVGHSAVNQAPVTGESIPVDKAPGDILFAGTLNESSILEFEVTATASNTTLSRIIHAVEKAQESRAPTQRFVDRFAARYTPTVFVIALAVALGGPWFFDWTWSQALYKALVLLVIACPCALVIATPVTVVSGLAAAARRGILIKGGAYLEKARQLRAIALDKTGTLTEGKPQLLASEMLTNNFPELQVRQWAASLTGYSTHPISQAIYQAITSTQALPEIPLKDFQSLPGRGISARIDGKTLILGNHRLIEENSLSTPAIEQGIKAQEQQGRSVVLFASESEVLALFAVADRIKPSTREAVNELRQLGITPVMLSGDNAAVASSVAREAGIDDARGQLLPEDKQNAIHELQQTYGPTAMTGDGINDAPALAQSDLGIAMGAAGTDTAMEAADILIMNDDLRRIPELIRLSRRTHAILWQNIFIALGIKTVFLVLAIAGNASMWMAVFADMGASLIVIANGLRLVDRKKFEQ